ncbi:MAG: YHS domain-containing protein [Chloroflexota bacterium]|nr:MAG: YHS domain-containing protein [Chloroflexota bacterium]
MAMDPVCGMQVDEKSPAATYEYKGKTYYFCSPGCKADFEKDPEKYLKSQPGSSQHMGPH